MKIVKLIVLILFTRLIRSNRENYCKICTNHTLCLYTIEERNPNCKNYDITALLSHQNIDEIVTRVNEKRNLIAMGLLNVFPQAANMKKIRWSPEIATFAQRWADQCDRSVKPDRHDHCRNTVNMDVGQNIATVVGPTPGLNVKSLVDTWFLQNIHYKGSVTYYNQSRDYKTNYFTQLIWADTELIGCGKAKFYIDELRTVVERIVCNFAPEGNKHGKPIYIIGYPTTQCSPNMIPDTQFPGLCKHYFETVTKSTVESWSSNGLLRIVNLSNNSVKQDLDPNNLRQINLRKSEVNDQRNQKTRQIYLNKSIGAKKRDSYHINPSHVDTIKEHQFTPEKGHSRMYHGYATRKEQMHSFETTKSYSNQDFRRYDFISTIPPYIYSETDYRKDMRHHQCTRKSNTHDCCSTNSCVTNKCTRGCSTSCEHTLNEQNACQPIPFQPNPCQPQRCDHVFSTTDERKYCSCNNQPVCLTPLPPCHSNNQCSTSCPIAHSPLCAKRRLQDDDTLKSTQPQYYDLIPNAEVRLGDTKLTSENSWNFDDTSNDYSFKLNGRRRNLEHSKQVKPIFDSLQNKNLRDPQATYHYFDSSTRSKRESEDQTFKPFWQMDEYNLKKPSELKSIRYTTLSNRGFKNTRTQTTGKKWPKITETLTVRPKNKAHLNRDRITEKYLSFDELMHLRKLSTAEPILHDARRKWEGNILRDNNDTKTTEATSAETVTANTPFIRMKHCTRKLTCTWTAQMMTGSGGNPFIPGGGMDIGSRTPPGYVDGCTRTSTCTRDYMDRNKMDSSSTEDGVGTTPEDEDYCERRSLNIRRRGISKDKTEHILENKNYVTENKREKPEIETKLLTLLNQDRIEDDCKCYEDTARIKRDYNNKFEQLLKQDCSNTVSKSNAEDKLYYSNFYGKTRQKSKVLPKCLCNGCNSLLI